MKPSARVFCDYWFEKNPEKIMGMRLDTFSQLITASGVTCGSRMLCVDETGGMLALGLLERMAGDGVLYCLHDKAAASLDMIRSSNMQKSFKSCIRQIPWHNMEGVVNQAIHSTDTEGIQRSQDKIDRKLAIFEDFKRGQFEGLVCASNYDISEIVNRLLPFLAPSSPVVVYAPKKEVKH